MPFYKVVTKEGKELIVRDDALKHYTSRGAKVVGVREKATKGEWKPVSTVKIGDQVVVVEDRGGYCPAHPEGGMSIAPEKAVEAYSTPKDTYTEELVGRSRRGRGGGAVSAPSPRGRTQRVDITPPPVAPKETHTIDMARLQQQQVQVRPAIERDATPRIMMPAEGSRKQLDVIRKQYSQLEKQRQALESRLKKAKSPEEQAKIVRQYNRIVKKMNKLVEAERAHVRNINYQRSVLEFSYKPTTEEEIIEGTGRMIKEELLSGAKQLSSAVEAFAKKHPAAAKALMLSAIPAAAEFGAGFVGGAVSEAYEMAGAAVSVPKAAIESAFSGSPEPLLRSYAARYVKRTVTAPVTFAWELATHPIETLQYISRPRVLGEIAGRSLVFSKAVGTVGKGIKSLARRAKAPAKAPKTVEGYVVSEDVGAFIRREFAPKTPPSKVSFPEIAEEVPAKKLPQTFTKPMPPLEKILEQPTGKQLVKTLKKAGAPKEVIAYAKKLARHKKTITPADLERIARMWGYNPAEYLVSSPGAYTITRVVERLRVRNIGKELSPSRVVKTLRRSEEYIFRRTHVRRPKIEPRIKELFGESPRVTAPEIPQPLTIIRPGAITLPSIRGVAGVLAKLSPALVSAGKTLPRESSLEGTLLGARQELKPASALSVAEATTTVEEALTGGGGGKGSGGGRRRGGIRLGVQKPASEKSVLREIASLKTKLEKPRKPLKLDFTPQKRKERRRRRVKGRRAGYREIYHRILPLWAPLRRAKRKGERIKELLG